MLVEGFGAVWKGGWGGYTNHDQPFWFLDPVGVGLGVSKRFPFCVFGHFDFVFGAVADEDGFAAPFDDYLYDICVNGRVRRLIGGRGRGNVRSCPLV